MSDELKPDIKPTATNSPVPVWIIVLMLVLHKHQATHQNLHRFDMGF